MAQLKNTVVSGSLRATDTIYTDKLHLTKIEAPTDSGGTDYGPGTSGQVLKSNGTSVYWSAENSDSNDKVKQTATTTAADYEILFSATADNTTRTEGARKTSTLTYNPNTKALSTGGTVDGLTLSPQTTGFKISGGTTSKTLTVGADYTLAAACAKDVDTSISASSSSANLPTSAAVATFVEGKGYKTTDHITTTTTSGSGNAVTAISADANGALTVTKDTTFLAEHQTIKQDGVTGATVNRFGTCDTAAGTAAKTVSITTGTFALEAGARVSVKFTNANTAGTPTLNVNSNGAKNIFHKGAQITTGGNKALLAGVVDFIYDGTQWHLIGNYIDTANAGSAGGNAKIFYGTCNSAADANPKVVTCADFTSADLVKGAMIYVTFDETNAVAVADIDINVNNTGDKRLRCVRNGAVADLPGVGYIAADQTYIFTYDGTSWNTVVDYNSNTTYDLGNNILSKAEATYTASAAVYRYRLVVQTGIDTVATFNTVSSSSANTNTSKSITTTLDFDPFGLFLYYSATTTRAKNAAIPGNQLYISHMSMPLAYTFNMSDKVNPLTVAQNVYMKVSPQANGKVRIASAHPLVQTLPSTNDGYWYIFLGRAYDSTHIALYDKHPVYYHNGTQICEKLPPGQEANIISVAAANPPATMYKAFPVIGKPLDNMQMMSAGAASVYVGDAEQGIPPAQIAIFLPSGSYDSVTLNFTYFGTNIGSHEINFTSGMGSAFTGGIIVIENGKTVKTGSSVMMANTVLFELGTMITQPMQSFDLAASTGTVGIYYRQSLSRALSALEARIAALEGSS